MSFFSLCSFSIKRALLKAPNEQDLYKKGAQDMVCMHLKIFNTKSLFENKKP